MSVNKRRLIIIVLTIFIIYSVGTIKSLHGINDFMYWLNLGVYILVIGYLTKLLYPGYTSKVKRVTVVLVLFSVYMALGTGLLHYQGEGGNNSDLLQSNVKNEIQYYIELHNGLNLPVNVDYTLLYGERGMGKIVAESSTADNKGTKDDISSINLIFKVTGNEAMLPTKAVVIYRILKVIPMVNVIELKWPEFRTMSNRNYE